MPTILEYFVIPYDPIDPKYISSICINYHLQDSAKKNETKIMILDLRHHESGYFSSESQFYEISDDL